MWADYLLFLLRAVTIVVAIAVLVVLVAAAVSRQQREPRKGKLVTENLSTRFDRAREQVQAALLPDRKAVKRWRKAQKAEKKQRQKGESEKGQAFVVDFKGDIQASQVKSLSESVNAVLQVAKSGDTVVVRLESPGGMVPGYGLAATQLERLRKADLKLWVTVDKVAASGGYMMAAQADRIFAAPFAIVGSIGVVAQVPNIHRLLKKHDIDVELHTAGEYKRTLTVLGENTRAGREKFKEELESTHALFKHYVSEARPDMDVTTVSDGDHWYGKEALDKGLVDELATSDDVLLRLHDTHHLLHIRYEQPQPLSKRISVGVVGTLEHAYDRFMTRNKPVRG